MSEDLTLGLFLFLEIIVEIFQRVGHHEVYGVIKLGKLLVIFVIGILFGLLPAVFYTVGRNIALFLVYNVLSFFAIRLTHTFLHVL